MARNGSGTYNRAVSPYVAGATIAAATVNSEMDDIATALTQSLSRDGQSPPTANLPMGNFRITGLGNAIASTDAAPLGQVVAKAGDTMTGALGFAVGTAALPGLFPAGDTNTGFFQAAAAPDTLSISVGGTEVARFGTGGFMRLADGTAAAPVYSFSGDTDTGIYSAGAGNVDIAANGQRVLSLTNSAGANFATLENATGNLVSALYMSLKDASATVSRASFIAAVNENFVPVSAIRKNLSTDGSSNIVLSATPAGSRASDRRVDRVTIPGDGAIAMVGPVDITSGNLNVTTGQLQVGGNPVTIQRDTEKTATGVSVDFTGIPAGVRRITVMFDSVSSNGTSPFMVQLGSTSIETTNYRVGGTRAGASNFAAHAAYTTGFAFGDSSGFAAAQLFTGSLEINLFNASNRWVGKGQIASDTSGGYTNFTSGRKELAGVLDRLRITTVNGTDTFDAGTINIMWEF